jgi:hypothetical protein
LRGWLAREDWAHTLDNYARCVRIIRGQAVESSIPRCCKSLRNRRYTPRSSMQRKSFRRRVV